jgi:hypothetical protein
MRRVTSMETFYAGCECGRAVLVQPVLTDDGPVFKLPPHRVGRYNAVTKVSYTCQKRKQTKCVAAGTELPRYGVA